jgi:lipoprotein-anchoring transpeptidase ErfK/SrfK
MWYLASRVALSALFASVFLTMLAHIARAEPLSLQPRYVVNAVPAPEPQPTPVRVAAARGNMGGGFFEAVFGGGGGDAAPYAGQRSAYTAYYAARGLTDEGAHPAMDPRYLPQTVAYNGPEQPGTIVVDTPNHFLYLVEAGGAARRYGIGVGRPGFTWAGVKTISAPTCRPSWRAVRKIRSARVRCISAPRSIASTARTSPGRSAPRSPPAASACATRTSSTSTGA